MLREARLRSGLSQRDLSLKLGQPPNYVNKVESGVRGIDVIGVVRLLRIIGASRTEFFAALLTKIDKR